MSFKGAKFGSGPKELGGSVDLISHYRLWPHHEFFCKKSLPLSISDTHYLQNVVGDREIREGGGMKLGQLCQDVASSNEKDRKILPFRLDVLADVFHMRETAAARLSSPDRGTPTVATKMEKKPKHRHHRKHKDREKHKSKDQKKHDHKSKVQDGNEVMDKKRDVQQLNGTHINNQEKKGRHNVTEDPSRIRRHQQMSVSKF